MSAARIASLFTPSNSSKSTSHVVLLLSGTCTANTCMSEIEGDSGEQCVPRRHVREQNLVNALRRRVECDVLQNNQLSSPARIITLLNAVPSWTTRAALSLVILVRAWAPFRGVAASNWSRSSANSPGGRRLGRHTYAVVGHQNLWSRASCLTAPCTFLRRAWARTDSGSTRWTRRGVTATRRNQCTECTSQRTEDIQRWEPLALWVAASVFLNTPFFEAPTGRRCRYTRSRCRRTPLLRPICASEHCGRRNTHIVRLKATLSTYIRCATPLSAVRASASPWTAAAISGKVVLERSAQVAGKYTSLPTMRTCQYEDIPRSQGCTHCGCLRTSPEQTRSCAQHRVPA